MPVNIRPWKSKYAEAIVPRFFENGLPIFELCRPTLNRHKQNNL